ncbi:hypothetical protein LTR10_000452 [Elasticomyces elasticus]|nr:hypothetical protein LTR10_000452 [Elasticomyces elasticus]KAK4980298.1 hypothetical protein LTR42_000605 [Elasticomyces elasticus]
MPSEMQRQKTPVYVWVVQHCQFDNEEDCEGHTTVLEVHANLASANQAAREHFDWSYEDTHEREEDEDDDEDEKQDYDDVKNLLNSNGCYESQHLTNDGCHGGPRYTHPQGYYLTMSVEGHFLRGELPAQQTEATTSIAAPATKRASMS